MLKIGLLVEEIHPLVELVERRLGSAQGVEVQRINWRDILYRLKADPSSMSSLLAQHSVIWLDRMGEEERGYSVQLLLLHEWSVLTGIPVVNSPLAYLYARDKALSGCRFASAGLSMPSTVVGFSQDGLALEAHGADCVVKSTQGVCAEEVVAGFSLSPEQVGSVLSRDGAAVLQEFVHSPDRCIWRVDIVNRQIVMMNRRFSYNSDRLSICNGNRGGHIELVGLEYAGETEVGQLALKASGVLELDVAGVDIIVSADGTPYLLEVNPEPDATYYNQTLSTGLPNAIADFLVKKAIEASLSKNVA
jgi:glutathione synthase/RimK-type ligase-like ATP-grasp enzyme